MLPSDAQNIWAHTFANSPAQQIHSSVMDIAGNSIHLLAKITQVLRLSVNCAPKQHQNDLIGLSNLGDGESAWGS